MKFFQSFFTEGMEALKEQTESAQSLMQELEQKTQQQLEAFQQLALQSMKSYFEFLSTPLSAYEQLVQAATRQVQNTEQKSDE